MMAKLDAALTERLLAERGVRRLGTPLTVVSQTGSTNDDALDAARRSACHGSTFVADEQTAGRGRRGHRWVSPAGETLSLSVVVRPEELPLGRWPWLPLVTGLAVRNAAQSYTPAQLSVKWPNDVLSGRRKLAGILAESRTEAGRPKVAVIGVGVNVSTTSFSSEIAETATSLAILGAGGVRREPLLASILAELETRLETLTRDTDAILAELTQHDALAGHAVRIDDQRGIARGFDAQGNLTLELGDGRTVAMRSGHVQWDD